MAAAATEAASFLASFVLGGLALSLVVSPSVSDAARAFFVFGDSLVDNGNNNYLVTTARADAPPYGIDYPTHQATGRFSNGINIPDIISRYSTPIHLHHTTYSSSHVDTDEE